MSTNKDQYEPVYNEILADELASISAILTNYTGLPPSDRGEHLSDDAVKREPAEDYYRESLEKTDIKPENMGEVYATFAKMQEAQRIRRDATICRQGHKALMAGCLETLFRRRLKLEKILSYEDATI